MKILYTFIETKEQEIEETESSTNEKGEIVSVTKKVKKEIPIKFGLRQPTRNLIDEGSLYYGVKFSEAVKAGLVTDAMINKRFESDGGILTEQEKAEEERKTKEFGEKRAEYEKLIVLENTGENGEKIKALEGELMSLRKRLNELDYKKSNAFDNTAETYARNKSSVWWFLNLAVKEISNDKFETFFAGETLDEKMAQWDELLESGDEFYKRICNKLLLLVSFYHRGMASTPADFDNLLKLAERSG